MSRPAPRRAAPRRRAEKPGSVLTLDGPIALPIESGPEDGPQRPSVTTYAVVVVSGLVLLLLALIPVGPSWLGEVGAVAVSTAYTAGLAARSGGRPLVFGGLALVMGVVVVALDDERLCSGAAVMTAVVSAVLAVMSTVPAVTVLRAFRECAFATVIALVGALAVLGFAPFASMERFGYATLALSLALTFGLVYRLGAGLHGLGRRGAVIVAVGGLVLVGALVYAELLRRYGTPELISNPLRMVRWSRHHLGAFPRPIMTVLGIPALAWGTHMRARRRQGWWVCAFGVAAMVSVADSLLDPGITLAEGVLSVAYGLVAGCVVGYVVIRIDLYLGGPPSTRRGDAGRRGRRAEEATAVRPEPERNRPLL